LFQGFIEAASVQGNQDFLEAQGRDLVAGKLAGN
jgi:CTP synthase